MCALQHYFLHIISHFGFCPSTVFILSLVAQQQEKNCWYVVNNFDMCLKEVHNRFEFWKGCWKSHVVIPLILVAIDNQVIRVLTYQKHFKNIYLINIRNISVSPCKTKWNVDIFHTYYIYYLLLCFLFDNKK